MGLKISRCVGERIHIGPDVVVLVTSIRDNKVRLDVTAPKAVEISYPPRPPCAADMRTPIDHRD